MGVGLITHSQPTDAIRNHKTNHAIEPVVAGVQDSHELLFSARSPEGTERLSREDKTREVRDGAAALQKVTPGNRVFLPFIFLTQLFGFTHIISVMSGPLVHLKAGTHAH